MRRLLIFCAVAVSLTVNGQTTEKYNSVYAGFYKAEELFQKQQYGSARKEFRDFINSFQSPMIRLHQSVVLRRCFCN
ncbi:MAG: hypothetical protein R2779_07880 [Crocinitomicaceae bacterium]